MMKAVALLAILLLSTADAFILPHHQRAVLRSRPVHAQMFQLDVDLGDAGEMHGS